MAKVKFEERWAPKPGQLEAVRDRIMDVHDNEETIYTSCSANGCFDVCLLKVHKKDGKVTAIETDDTCNLGSGREDEYVSEDTLRQGIVQHRACPRGRALKDDLYSDTRLLYPMKRIEGTERGSRQFERITWDEALDTIADQYLKTREKYGPYSVWGDAMTGTSHDAFAPYMPGGGIGGSGMDSFYPNYLADEAVYGHKVTQATWIAGTAWGATEGPSILDSELIILWGFDTVLNYPEYQYWFQLAKDKGIPIIYIDPRYTNTAQAIAKQYIPIRPGTDAAAMLAMAYVMFSEGIYDKEFCDKWVEPKGLEMFRAYVMGEEEGDVPKTPEWAAEICGIPAETLRQLTRLYCSKDRVYFRQVWAAARLVNGADTARIFNYINVLGGNVGKPGTSIGTGFDLPHNVLKGRVFPYLGTAAPEYDCPKVCESEQWARAVLLHEKMENGEISEAEYKRKIGCPENSPAPNIKALLYLIESPRQFIGNYQDTSERIAAIKKLDFVGAGHWNLMASSNFYADVLVPFSDWRLEGGSCSGYKMNGPFGYGLSPSLGNYFVYYNKVVEAAGEARHPWWVEHAIAERLGIGDKLSPLLRGVEPEDMDEAVDQLMGASYERWAATMDEYDDETVPKKWEAFKKKGIIRIPLDKPNVKFQDEIESGKGFATPSGKIEFYSERYASQNPYGPSDMYGASLGAPLSPMARWKPSRVSYFSPDTNEYPLYLVTPHSFFRQNMNQDANLLMRDEYRNSVWINPADAKKRDIKDGDMVMAYNDRGEIIVPAYVTSRITPGTACVIFGRYYAPSGIKTEKMPDGIDVWGNCNFLVPNRQHGDIIGPLLCSGLIEVKKAGDVLGDIPAIAQTGGNE